MVDLKAMCEGMQGFACGRTLTELTFACNRPGAYCTLSPEDLTTLGGLISGGFLSSLEKLGFNWNYPTLIGQNVNKVALLINIKTIPEDSSSILRELVLCNTGMTDEGVSAFVSAVEDGAFRTLSSLDLSFNEKITDRGALILQTSITKGHFKDIQRLAFSRTNIKPKGVVGLLKAVLFGCPNLRYLIIPCIGRDLGIGSCGSPHSCRALPPRVAEHIISKRDLIVECR